MGVHRRVTWILSAITILAAAGAAAGVAAAAEPAAVGSAAAGPATVKSAPVGQGSLAAVSGTSAHDVWAVGSNSSGAGTLIVHWNGVRWSTVPSPSPGTGEGRTNGLSGVAAVSPTDAWAVGSYSSGPHEGDVTAFGLIEHWNGKRWSKVPCPCGKGNGATPTLNGISAVSRSDIWAVGAGNSAVLLLHWNGSKWAAVRLPGDQGDSLTAVSATSARNAWVVGYSRGAGPGLTAHWNGRKWSWVPVPRNGQQFTDLRAVAAASPSSAWAGGLAGKGVDALHWKGGKWSAVPGPKVTGRSNTFDTIAAVPGGGAWGVGFRTTVKHGDTFNLIARWTRAGWVTVPSPDIRRSDTDYLMGAWASSSRSVWAVGASNTPRNLTQILHWNGKRWRLVIP